MAGRVHLDQLIAGHGALAGTELVQAGGPDGGGEDLRVLRNERDVLVARERPVARARQEDGELALLLPVDRILLAQDAEVLVRNSRQERLGIGEIHVSGTETDGGFPQRRESAHRPESIQATGCFSSSGAVRSQ